MTCKVLGCRNQCFKDTELCDQHYEEHQKIHRDKNKRRRDRLNEIRMKAHGYDEIAEQYAELMNEHNKVLEENQKLRDFVESLNLKEYKRWRQTSQTAR